MPEVEPRLPIENKKSDAERQQSEFSENYLEELREFAHWLENQQSDPHSDFIHLDEMIEEELELFDKFQEGILTEEELKMAQEKYVDALIKKLQGEGKSVKEISEAILKDGGSNFYAMMRDKLIGQKYQSKKEKEQIN
ncbi:MAG TPA: hypothetical protein PLX73_01040 [Candidatus Paceibacterota bacterium]|nr:hypothetical protein [Candidatus Paceibacterota bacterium]HOL53935.1 hypothetical protein [Candidatus Paceibacterota bacterium]HON21963.1 hypothetical protein [Candidatus Paceibacterota bacterium]HPP16958.1 hypothetical protein [Candidatus Paceibacterota bacterium]